MNALATPRISTGVPLLDSMLHGGLPRGSVTVVSGPPGSGKTILAQQLAFSNATPAHRVLSFNTLSEPTAKTLRYLTSFDFFDAGLLQGAIEFVDLGGILRSDGLNEAANLMLRHIKAAQPAIVIVDSFKVFDDLAATAEEQRKFGYEMAVNLMAWETTALLLGEYGTRDVESNPLFSIVDGMILMSQRMHVRESQRFIRVSKMRGTDHDREDAPFRISSRGIEIFPSRATVRASADTARRLTHIDKLDELLGDGIVPGASLIVSGPAGTGKTVLSLEFLYRGALAGEKGIYFSFEESAAALRATARGFGWELDGLIERGLIEIVTIEQPDVHVESDLLLIRDRVAALGAQRVVVDSLSRLLNKIDDARESRDKTFHLTSIVRAAGAIGLLVVDRQGVEETAVDGVLLLSSVEEGMARERYFEVYKLRNNDHLQGRHSMVIGPKGISIFPRYVRGAVASAPMALDTERLGTGITGLDPLIGGGLLRRSVTLLSGSAGAGKSTAAMQFLLEGARLGQRGLYVTLEEGPDQLLASADALGLPLRAARDSGVVEILHLARDQIGAVQLLSLLADRLRSLDATRVVIDALTQLVSSTPMEAEQLRLIYRLMLRFKSMGVTTILTLESENLFFTDAATERSLSPVADNLLLLRYQNTPAGLETVLTILKTRGSTHARKGHPIVFAQGGLRVEARAQS